MLIFDIETEALPDDQLFALADPYQPPEPPGEFDPSSVKYGNTKAEDKLADILAAAKAKHDAEVLGFQSSLAGHRQAWEFGIRDKAALSAGTARVLAIGYMSISEGKEKVNIDGDLYTGDKQADDAKESVLLARFWSKAYAKMKSAGRSMIGVYVREFDLPFLVRRSWALDVSVPATVFDGRYWDKLFVDLTELFKLGQRMNAPSGSYSSLAKAFGTPGKPEGVDGSQFALLWKTDKSKAIEYLANDLRQPAIWAKRMGILQ